MPTAEVQCLRATIALIDDGKLLPPASSSAGPVRLRFPLAVRRGLDGQLTRADSYAGSASARMPKNSRLRRALERVSHTSAFGTTRPAVA